MLRQQRIKLVGQHAKPLRQRRRGVGLDLPVGDVPEAISFRPDQPPTGGAEAGIEAQNSHFPSPSGEGLGWGQRSGRPTSSASRRSNTPSKLLPTSSLVNRMVR